MQNSRSNDSSPKGKKKAVIWVIVAFLALALFSGGVLLGFCLAQSDAESESETIETTSDSKKEISEDISIALEALMSDGSVPSSEDLEATESILRARLDGKGYTDADIRRKNNRFSINLPSDAEKEETIAFLTKTAILQFVDADGNVVLEGKDIKDARAEYSAVDELGTSQHHVVLKLNSEAREKFKNATKQAAGRSAEGKNFIAIMLDGELISSPSVGAEYASTGIDSDEAVITMGEATDEQTAADLANLIKFGFLPVELKQVNQ